MILILILIFNNKKKKKKNETGYLVIRLVVKDKDFCTATSGEPLSNFFVCSWIILSKIFFFFHHWYSSLLLPYVPVSYYQQHLSSAFIPVYSRFFKPASSFIVDFSHGLLSTAFFVTDFKYFSTFGSLSLPKSLPHVFCYSFPSPHPPSSRSFTNIISLFTPFPFHVIHILHPDPTFIKTSSVLPVQ